MGSGGNVSQGREGASGAGETSVLYPKVSHAINEQIPIAGHIARDASVLIRYVNDNVLRRARRVRRLCSHLQSVKKV